MKSLTTTVVGSAVTLPTMYQGTFTPTQPARQVSIGQFPASNPNWARTIQVSDQAVFIKYSTYAVAISLPDLINLAFTVEPNLTWTPPIILTQPVAASCVHSSTAATFTVVPGSEYTLTYQWQYYNGSAWTNITSSTPINGCAYTGYNTATLTATPTTTGQNGVQHKCIVTDNAGSFGLTNGSVTTNVVILTIT
jgi:hypothetical protein